MCPLPSMFIRSAISSGNQYRCPPAVDGPPSRPAVESWEARANPLHSPAHLRWLVRNWLLDSPHRRSGGTDPHRFHLFSSVFPRTLHVLLRRHAGALDSPQPQLAGCKRPRRPFCLHRGRPLRLSPSVSGRWHHFLDRPTHRPLQRGVYAFAFATPPSLSLRPGPLAPRRPFHHCTLSVLFLSRSSLFKSSSSRFHTPFATGFRNWRMLSFPTSSCLLLLSPLSLQASS